MLDNHACAWYRKTIENSNKTIRKTGKVKNGGVMKIRIEELQGLSFDDGVKLLEKNEYYNSGNGAPDGAEARDIKVGESFWTDIYYTLEDEDGGEHTVSFAQEWEKGETQEEDSLLQEKWTEV